MPTKNPYANADGTPVDGKEPEFFQWEQERHQEELNSMSAEEGKLRKDADARLADRMNS